MMKPVASQLPEAVIRPMRRAELTAVHAIECDSQFRPWSQDHFRAELENPVAKIDVLVVEGQVAGFLCSWLIAGELQIQNLATARQFRRRGVAGRLLAEVLARSRAAGMESAWLEVRAANAAAISLYRKWGFEALSRRVGYYADGEDALVLCRRETNL